MAGSGGSGGSSGAGGIIDPMRSVDWSQAGIPGGIPNRTTSCATLNAGATATQISDAIASCPSGQVVTLGAGTFNLSSGIDFHGKSDVTLRGAGADMTRLVFTGSVDCRGMSASICLDNGDTNWVGGPSNVADWTAGYAKGSTVITLSSTTNLMVGNALILDQLDDNSDGGGIFVCGTTVCTGEGANGSRDGRAQGQIVRVTAINGNQVTITPGLRMPNWRASQSPGAWWANTNIKNSGVEDLSVDATGSTTFSNIYIFNGLNCWVRGVRSMNPNRNHVWLLITAQSVVRDSYFYGTKNAASQSYGVEWYPGCDNLVENNIFQHVTAPLVQGAFMTGDVVAFNYAIDDYYSVSAGWMMPMFTNHNGGDGMILLEGNDGLGIQSDNIHGTHHFVTLFRNNFYGDVYNNPSKDSNTEPMHFWAYSRFFNVIGNVLGRSGFYNAYESNLTSNPTAIYAFGDADNRRGAAGDPVVRTTLLRWGNYDTVNGTTRFDASEVPSSLPQFSNAVPAGNVLPASFYLPAKPSWFRQVPWPPIGPDVMGGPGAAGHAYKIPAHLCYDNTPKDAGGVLIFNAASCYY